MKRILSLMIVWGLLFSLAGCGTETSTLLGKWSTQDIEITFFSDGTFVLSEGGDSGSGTYTAENGLLRMEGDNAEVWSYRILHDKALVIEIDGERLVLERSE